MGPENPSHHRRLQHFAEVARKKGKERKEVADIDLLTHPMRFAFAEDVVVFQREGEERNGVGGWTVTPHWRRGHWRLQPCGPGRSERKRIAIPSVLVNGHLLVVGPRRVRHLERRLDVADGPADIGRQQRHIERWRRELTSFAGFKVGIAWQGNPQFKNDRQRSIPLAAFAPLASVDGVHLLGLQKGHGTEQLSGVIGRFRVTDLGNQLDRDTGTFMDTAAAMKVLDLVITSDTAIAHLAGGLGVPVWVVLPYAPDWRWLLEREDCPWYPTMRLFRQRRRGDWAEVFGRVQVELRRRIFSAV